MNKASTQTSKISDELDFSRVRRVKRPHKGNERVTLRTVREALGMTQADVAKKLETDQGEVSRIERRPDILLSTIRNYARALGLECDVVLSFKDGRTVRIADPEPEGLAPR
jgi:transcriptional regulator with XRE-family HTH domain